MTLENERAGLRSHLRDLVAERNRRYDEILARPIIRYEDYAERGHAFAAARQHYEPMVDYISRRLVEAEMATEQDGVIFVHPLKEPWQANEIIRKALA